jgi:hypothetical protein
MHRSPPPLGLPRPRGPLSAWVLDRLRGLEPPAPPVEGADGFGGDVQLALYLCYETTFSALPGACRDLEWDLDLLGVRGRLEACFEAALRDSLPPLPTGTSEVGDLLDALLASDGGPSVSSFVEHAGTLEHVRDVVVQRSPLQLKEADPHTLGIPRLVGRAKHLLATIQAGEYGADEPGREMHVALFAATMRALGLDDRRHAYLDVVPATSLAISNLVSLFGFHRRRRGALVGHLAVFEMDSSVPAGRYARALERLGAPPAARRFYDVHVLADTEHAVIAREMAQALARDEPALRDDIVFGARCVVATERRFADALLARWAISGVLVDA